ncbi:nickel ABC transporter substrate-binding protein [Helicobacter sp.]|uniref:nickel ABC transporter substrate-binding protein n=1 Tax=Helicobacter sp. TaxID=218 RepID=UPI0025BF8278|nr:nickel ABC transporter substrate-binding protein [Helicobacter sp.]
MMIILLCVGVLWGKNTLIMAVSENIGVLNPQGYQGNAMFAQNAVYEGLVRADKNGHIVPSLALSWEISEDALQYDFILREGVRFSNGESFDADSVVLNFRSVLKNRSRHSWSGLAVALESVQKLAPYKVRLRLKEPYSPTLNELAAVRPFRFVAPSAIPADLDMIKHNPKAIGTGAYMLEKSIYGVSDTLVKNPHYWDKKQRIYYDEVICKVIFDPSAKLAALKSGQIDMIYGDDQIPLEIFKGMQNNPQFKTYLSPPLYSLSLVVNSASPVFKLENSASALILRKALRYAINKQRLIKAVYGGLQEDTDCIFPTSKDCEKEHSTHSIQSQEALAFLRNLVHSVDSPLAQKGIEILYIGDNPAHKKMAEIIQNDLNVLGVKVRISASEPTIYHHRLLKGAFDMAFREGWGAPYEPLSELHSMLLPSHIDYAAQLGLSIKPLIDKEIRGVIALNPTSKAFHSTLRNLISMLEESGVYIPLTSQRNKAIAHKKIQGIDMGVLSYEVPFWDFYED